MAARPENAIFSLVFTKEENFLFDVAYGGGEGAPRSSSAW
jgi:hypothetical protein